MYKVALILLILSVFRLIQAQNDQDAFVKLEVSASSLEVGETFSITISSNTEGSLELSFPDQFIQNSATHSGMSTSVNYINGKKIVERISYQKLSGVFSQKGEFELGPVVLHTQSNQIESNRVTISVKEPLNMISADPKENMREAIFGIIQQSKKQVYQGEPLFVDAKVYSQIDIYQVDNFIPFQFEGVGESHELKKQNQITQKREVVNGTNVLTFELGRSVIFPEQSGTFEISPFEMVLFYENPRKLFPERTKIRSNTSVVEVIPLPNGAPESFKGGVGTFNISSSCKRNKIEQGKVVELSIVVSGKGNLHLIEQPHLNLPKGLILYGDPEIKDAIQFTNNGAEGSVTYTYFLQVNSKEDIVIPSLPLSYFSLQDEEYKTVYSNSIKLEVTPNGNPISLPQEDEIKEMIPTPIISKALTQRTSKPSNITLFTNWNSMILGLPILAGFCIGLFLKLNHAEHDQRMRKLNTKNAFSNAKDELDNLKNSDLSNKAHILTSLLSIMETFLSQKLALENRVWNSQLEEINTKNLLSNDNIERLKEFKRNLETESYNPTSNGFSAEENIQSCMKLIQEIEVKHDQNT